MDVTRQWYIEAWSVRDGLAFASYRSAGSLSHHERTVFIGVPGLDVVPLGRFSPALWATRANFQDGFLSEAGEEIGLKTLDQVRELVRRGYLAGGIGPGPGAGGGGGGGPDQPRGQPPVPSPQVGAAMDAMFENFEAVRFSGSGGIGRPETRKRVFESLLAPPMSERVLEGVALMAGATLAAWYDMILQPNGPIDDATELASWMRLLTANVGIWEWPPDVHHIASVFGVAVAKHKDEWLGSRWWWLGLDDARRDDILLQVPCPLRRGWDGRIRHLSDKLLLAVSTHDYFDANPGLPELMPAILAALAVVSASRGPLVARSGDARRERLRAALAWLDQQMPQEELPPAAEAALEAFAWNELSGR